MAHIYAFSDDGPRAEPTLDDDARDDYNNLILLCPTHHTLVDKQPLAYTANELRAWKSNIEQWVRYQLARDIRDVSFAELQVVARAISATPLSTKSGYQLTPPREKMARNSLTARSETLITLGLTQVSQVKRFVEHVAQADSEFPERLKAGFVAEYNRLVNTGFIGDALFEALMNFAAGYSASFKEQAAGLSVLTYLFEKCEVFEA